MLERIFVTTHHNRERASNRARISTAHWRVKHGYAHGMRNELTRRKLLAKEEKKGL